MSFFVLFDAVRRKRLQQPFLFIDAVTFFRTLRLISTMNQQEESRHITRILNGETRLFSLFVEQYSHPNYTLIVQIVCSPEHADELQQDSLMKAFNSLTHYNVDCRFLTWLYLMVYYVSIPAPRTSTQPVLLIL